MARSLALASAIGFALSTGAALAQTLDLQPAAPAAKAAKPVHKHPKPHAAAEKAPAAEKAAAEKEESSAAEIPTPKVAPGQQAWTKICNTDEKTHQEICATQQELRNEGNQPLAFARIQEMIGQPKKFLIIAVPSGVYLPAGLKVQIDRNKHVNGQYMTCQGPLCIARADADANLLAQMKKGEKLVVTAISPQNKALAIPFALTQFKEVYESKGLDAKQLESEQQKLQDELKKRADEARKKLMEQQTTQPVGQPAK